MNILFIGNSYTFFNEMPKMLEALAEENGNSLRVDSVTKGGRKLYANLQDGDEWGEKIKSLIGKREYDVLILQEQSYFSLVDYDKFLFGIKGLIDLVKPKRTILYSTWGRKIGCPLLDELKLTSEEMTDKLTKAYISAALSADAELSHVGKAFVKISKVSPDIELYNPDLSHPSYAGSAVAAICHYRAIFKEMPEKFSSLNLEAKSASVISACICEVFDEK